MCKIFYWNISKVDAILYVVPEIADPDLIIKSGSGSGSGVIIPHYFNVILITIAGYWHFDLSN